MKTTTSDILTIEELAEALKVSPKTVQRWHADGVIPAEVAEGKTIRFSFKRVTLALRRRAATTKPKSQPKMVPVL